MSVPFLATKLYISSPRPGLVPRPRLIEYLNDGLDKGFKLTLISAPAGFGKTTLVSEWIAHCGRLVAWLSVDEGDNDPVRFISYVIAALQTIRAGIADRLLATLQSPQVPSAETILTILLNEITLIPEKFIFVLDDYHIVDSKLVDEALTFLIKNQPPQMHVVIVTREDPLLPLARLRAKGQLSELRAADLRFTPVEATGFLNQVMRLNLTEEDIAALETRTEGWIAGLQMAALSMQGRENITDFIQTFSGSHHFVLDYLVEEVLQQQPESIRDFLLRSSILNRMCGSQCDAVLGTLSTSGQETLEYLEHTNLFIVPLDNERRWYRYHHLFAELLRHRLTQSSSPEEITALHIHASEWYENNEMAFEAFQHAVSANDVPRAERLMESREMGLHRRTVAIPVLDWLNSLPNDVRDARPRLWVRAATLALMAGKTSTVEPALLGAEVALQSVELDAEIHDLIGQLACAKATYAFFHYDFETMLAQAHRALEYLNPENMTYQFTANWALANALRVSGKRSDANRATQDCLAISQKSPSMFSRILAVMNLAVLQEMNNQLFQAADTYRQAIELSGDHPQPNMAEAHFGLARIYYEWNDLKSAEEHDQCGLQMARMFDQEVDRFIVNEVFLARLRLAQGDLAGAAGMLAQTERTARRKNYALRFADIAELQILILLSQSNITAAAELAGQYELPFSQSRVLLAQDNAPAALAILEPILEQSKEKGWVDKQLSGMVLQTLALSAKHEKDEALRILEESLTMAEPGGFVRLFLDEGTPVKKLLIEASARGMRSEYLAKLLAAFTNEKLKAGKKSITPELPFLISPLSSREMEILQLIAQGLSNREICDRLFLALSTVKGHIRVTFDKLQVQRRTEAIARARELGLL